MYDFEDFETFLSSLYFKGISPNDEVYVDEKLLFIYKEPEEEKKKNTNGKDSIEENHFTVLQGIGSKNENSYLLPEQLMQPIFYVCSPEPSPTAY